MEEINHHLNVIDDALLAKLKAQWQAEALDEAADMADKGEDDWLRELAKQTRRQAEEGEPDAQ